MKPMRKYSPHAQSNRHSDRPEPFMVKGKAPLFNGEEKSRKPTPFMFRGLPKSNVMRKLLRRPLMPLLPHTPRPRLGAPRQFAPPRPRLGAPRQFAPPRPRLDAPRPFASKRRNPF